MIHFKKSLLLKLIAAITITLPSCKCLFGTLGGERICLTQDTATAHLSPGTLYQTAKKLKTSLGYKNVSSEPDDIYEGRLVGSSILLSNSPQYPGWNVIISYYHERSELQCHIIAASAGDAINMDLGKRVYAELKTMYPGANLTNCTACRGIAAP